MLFNTNSCSCKLSLYNYSQSALYVYSFRMFPPAHCSICSLHAFLCDNLCTYQKCAVRPLCCSCMHVFHSANNILASALLCSCATIFAAVFFVLVCLYTYHNVFCLVVCAVRQHLQLCRIPSSHALAQAVLTTLQHTHTL